jgi:hypothetical protein
MNLFLVNNDRTIDQIIQLPEYVPGRDCILCFNYLAYLRLKKEQGKHIFKFIEEIFTDQDYQLLHSKTDQFAFDWYRKDGIDRTEYNGISYGKLVQIMFSRTYNLSIKIKYAEAVRKLIKQTGKVEVIYYDFLNAKDSIFGVLNMPEVIRMIAQLEGTETRELKPDAIIPDTLFIGHILRENRQKRPLLRLKLLPKYLINWISDVRGAFNGKVKVYLFDYPNIETILNYYPHRLVITDVNKRLLRWPVVFSGLKFLQFEDVPYELSPQEQQFLDSLKNDFISDGDNARFGCDFMINGFDYKNVYKPVIEEIVLKVIPGLLIYAGQVKQGTKRANIKTILMRDCLDEKYRTVVAVCKQEKIKTVFVDHGIIGHSHAQRVADQSSPDEAVTTIASYNPYHFQSKLLVLGNPSMDPYPAQKRKKVTSIKKVLFLNFEDNFYARLDRFSYQEKFYEEVFTGFKDLLSEGIEIYFRPHSSDKDYYEYLFKFFGVDPSKIMYATKGSFTDLIYEMDLLVTNISTCFFEAQAAGVPAIFMEPNFNKQAVLPPYDGVDGEEVLRMSTRLELVKLILSNRKDPQYLNNFLDKFLNKYAPKYMGPLDGMASNRIMEYVCWKEGL